MKKLNIFFPLAFLFSGAMLLESCTKDITVDLPDAEPQLVVEGGIEENGYPWVVLSKSVSYFAPVDSASLAENIVVNATVIVSNGVTTDTLNLTFDPNFIIPLVYKGNAFTGVAGQTYTLRIIVPGFEDITSTTTIPQPIPLDSLWFEVEPDQTGQDSLGFMWAHLSDPAGMGQGYRWFAKRINKDNVFIPPFGSAFDDKFVDGKSFDFGYSRGSIPGSTAPDDTNNERGYFKTNDTVVVKFTTIGAREVAFFRTYEIEVSNNGNPFAAPGVIESNVNGGLGVFCGYGVYLDTVITQ